METNETTSTEAETAGAPVAPPSPATTAAANGELYGVLAEFRSPGELITAAKKVRDQGYAEFDCYSPFPVHGIDEAMGIKRTILPLLVFGGGFTGLILGLLLQWWTNAHDWAWNVSGKPEWSLPANIPIAFETTILLSVFTTFFGMWALNKLPQVWHPFFRLDRFARVTDDSFMLGIEAKDKRFDEAVTTKLLKDAGALEVENCYLDPDPAKKQMPKVIYAVIITTTMLALVPFALIAKARASKSTKPHYHLFDDMDFQAKAKSDSANSLFADGRTNRGAVAGTIARGSLNADDVMYRGLEHVDVVQADGTTVRTPKWITGLPAQVEPTTDLMKRGQNRYNIYCAPCHGYDGRGAGAIPARANKLGLSFAARNLVDPAIGVPNQPNGQIFNTISNGFNTMSGYSHQLSHNDRWAVVLYVRALQRGQNAERTDDPDALQDVH